ncbi:MAG: four helix bundle protein [Planctomycetota bacterium]|nr:four helix bundle protein [Planctomycetota bacterium]
MQEVDLKRRTKQFALRAMQLAASLDRSITGRTLANQLVRSGTSVGANYRSACRARSKAEFISRLGVVEEEADESAYWMELIIEAGLMPENRVKMLLNEADQLVAIVVASRRSVRRSASFENRKSKIEN